MGRILVLDNYDSFTWNLVHLVRKLVDDEVDVIQNDAADLEKINQYDRIILSPGPGLPAEAGMLVPLVQQYAPSKSILGICLGHQAIGEAFGASLENLDQPYHGVATTIHLNRDHQSLLFKGLPPQIRAGRYHSWVIRKETLPTDFLITSMDEEGNIMSMEHHRYDLMSVQFHPESILTPDGEALMRNWLNK